MSLVGVMERSGLILSTKKQFTVTAFHFQFVA